MSRTNISISRDWVPIRFATLTRALHLLLVLAVLLTVGALSQAQSNFSVIHNFTGPDGATPQSAVTLDRQGNLYGTTWYGGRTGNGLVFELTRVNGSWILHRLYNFLGQSDGGQTDVGVTFGSDGTLFGATGSYGAYQRGTLFNLKPPAHACGTALCPWTEVTLHSFTGDDGAYPEGDVVFDSQGNLYGTTGGGGTYGGGTVYKATLSGGTWNVSALHSFGGPNNDGYRPLSRVVLDSAGNIYGTASEGGAYGVGMVFELSPVGEDWIETDLHSFTGGQDDGWIPLGGLVSDRAGNLYGTTLYEAKVFELSRQGGDWNFTTIYTLGTHQGSYAALTIDTAGNLYGTSLFGMDGHGTVFELSPSSGGGWTYTDLHDFTDEVGGPWGGVAVTGPGGYLYGTTIGGGEDGLGVIYQINLGAH